MRKRRICLLITAIFGMLVAGCTTTDFKANMVGEYNLIPKIAGKDFVVLGLVSVTATETTTVSAFHISTKRTGEQITFDLLLREAKRLYPDVSDIINVRIDRVDQSRTSIFDFLIGYTRTVKYLGNAIAIQYTTALEEVRGPLEGSSGTLPGAHQDRKKGGIIGAIGGILGL
jgi:hypothetical protein